jgi:flagellar biosynthetic protein FlhB
MAESEQGGEQTEAPSQRRLDKAREHGQVPRSRELTNFTTMICASVTLVAIGGSLTACLTDIMRKSFGFDTRTLSDPDSMMAAFGGAVTSAIVAILPIFAVLIGVVLLASLLVGGWNFSPGAMTPNFSRMSPVAGFGRLFGLHGATELGKALLKCLVIGGVCAAIVWHAFPAVMSLGHMPVLAATTRGAHLISRSLVWLSSSLAIIAMVDVPLQLFQHNRMLRMSRQELKDEAKESDGRPETKQRIRQMQQQLARRRMMHKVPTADVVIVNPTHFAVALKYDPANMRAPRLLAKGQDLVAANIRRIAEEHRIPVFESPKLARALYKSTDLNHEIPAGLYVAVAQVLSYIFRLRTLSPTLAARMVRPNPTVGDEYSDA